MGILFSFKFLSVKIICLMPSLTAISDKLIMLSKAFFKVEVFSNVQSIIVKLLSKYSLNFKNCEFDNIGLSKT